MKKLLAILPLLLVSSWVSAAPTIQWAGSPYVQQDNAYLVPGSYVVGGDEYDFDYLFLGPQFAEDSQFLTYQVILVSDQDEVSGTALAMLDTSTEEWVISETWALYQNQGSYVGSDLVIQAEEFQSFLVPEPVGLLVPGILPLLLRRGSRPGVSST